jgi:hypothetical protein
MKMTCNVCPLRTGFSTKVDHVYFQESVISCHDSKIPIFYPHVLDVDGERYACVRRNSCPAVDILGHFPSKDGITTFVQNGMWRDQYEKKWRDEWSRPYED